MVIEIRIIKEKESTYIYVLTIIILLYYFIRSGKMLKLARQKARTSGKKIETTPITVYIPT